jgi:heme oxygenase (biliverdin-IX-beta and delta-forming)
MRGVYAPLEQALASAPGLAGALPDHAQRRKLPLLDADLRDLGVDPATIADCPATPHADTTARVLGLAYVMEGATLGGTHIRRHVRAHVPPPAPGACRFLSPYGDRTGAMWRAFQAALARHDGDRDEVLRAADETFATLESWLDRQGVLT